jgi:hypothetical protein
MYSLGRMKSDAHAVAVQCRIVVGVEPAFDLNGRVPQWTSRQDLVERASGFDTIFLYGEALSPETMIATR